MFKRKVNGMRARLHVVTAVTWLLLYTAVMPVSAVPRELEGVMQAIEYRIRPDGPYAYESLFVLRDLETVDTPPPVTGMQTRRVRLTWKGDDYWLAAAYDYDTSPSRRAAVASYFPGNEPDGHAYHPRPVVRFASRVAGIGRSVTLLRKHCVSASGEHCGYTESLFVSNDPPGDSHMEFCGFRDMILGGLLARASFTSSTRVSRDHEGTLFVESDGAGVYSNALQGSLGITIRSNSILSGGEFVSLSGDVRLSIETSGTMAADGLMVPREARYEWVETEPGRDPVARPASIVVLSIAKADGESLGSARGLVERAMQLPGVPQVFAGRAPFKSLAPDAALPLAQELKASLDAP